MLLRDKPGSCRNQGLSVSDPEDMCYLETKNLDGEMNLKPRKAVNGTSTIASEEDIIKPSSFHLDSEPPHQNLYQYYGVLRYDDPTSGERRRKPVTTSELLLPGHHAEGAVVHSGIRVGLLGWWCLLVQSRRSCSMTDTPLRNRTR